MNKYTKVAIGVICVISLMSVTLYYGVIAGDSVRIGDQKWTTKNLDVSTFRNGDSIPEARSKEEWDAYGKQGKPAWCYYNNDPANGKLFGKLYNGYAVMDPRGLAPKGWHIPSYDEWMALVNHEGGESIAGITLMSEKFWNRRLEGKNKSGFTAVPNGWRSDDFSEIGHWMLCWSTTGIDMFKDQMYVFIIDWKGSAYLLLGRKENGCAVRCIKD